MSLSLSTNPISANSLQATVSETEEKLGYLNNLVDTLTERLQPLLAPSQIEKGQAPNIGVPGPVRPELVERVADLNARIRGTSGRIESILDRLAL